MLTYGSVCSGIEAVSVAWKGLMTPLWFSEIEPFPCAVLAHHYPDIPNLGDMTALPQKIINREIPPLMCLLVVRLAKRFRSPVCETR